MENILVKIKDKIKPLLILMFPLCQKSIEFQYKDDFKEWFGMLFKLNNWNLEEKSINISKLHLSKTQIKKSEIDLHLYEDIENFGIISTVEINNELHLIDGYHRVLIARQRGLEKLQGCVWSKIKNKHINCDLIKNLILKNL